MTAAGALRRYRRARRLTQLGLYGCGAFPLAFLATVLAWRVLGAGLANAALIGVGLLAAQVVGIDWLRRAHRVTAASIARHLDHRFPALEDSTALVGQRASASPLRRLQRERIGERLLALRASGELSVAPRRGAQWRAVWLVLLGAGLGNAVWLWPQLEWPATQPAATALRAPALTGVRIAIEPPGYTGMASTEAIVADVRVPESSALGWTLLTDAPARSVDVVTDDGERIPLDSSDGLRWQSPRWPARATTYQVRLDGAPAPLADEGIVHRVAIVRDDPPTLDIERPARASTEITGQDGQGVAPVRVSLSVRDDYGVSGVIGRATLATGSGEQVEFRETPVALDAVDEGAGVRVDTEVDLVALGMTPGSELYLFFEAIDNRPDAPNVTASSTYVFRWPTDEAGPRVAVEGRAIDVPPEYFRSQRQIIIDTEALIREQPELGELEFVNRAQALAFDQKALRLRYGQFLGEEDESSIGPMPTGAGDDPDAAEHQGEHDEAGEGADGDGHFDGDGHDHGADGDGHFAGDGHDHGDDFPADGSRFGDAAAAIEPYAHFHDREEQSTLFDPQTTSLLRQALSAMWDSEGELRMRRPGDALPHQYRALAFIKRVQQASRIYVARVGFRPTPIDEGRRLTGELDDIDAGGTAPLAAAEAERDAAVESAIRSVSAGQAPPSGDAAAALRHWLERGLADARGARNGDREERLQRAMQALLDWQSRPACAECRDTLLEAVWRYWDEPVAVPARRRSVPDPFAAPPPSVTAR